MNTFAVITGDIVNSANILNKQRDQMLKALKDTLIEINTEINIV